MGDATLPLFEWARNRQDDYTGAVCWLFWRKRLNAFDTRQALVDAEDFERLKHHTWSIQKVGKCRKLRVVRGDGVYLAREVVGFPPGKIVDHADRDSLNDRRRNLRVCTVGENNLNRTQRDSARSRYKGVAWLPDLNLWQVYPGRRGQRVLVGYFRSELEAARAYNEYARKHLGPFAYLNPL